MKNLKKYIVCTSINKPTLAVKKFDQMRDWNLVIVGDKKTPKNYKLKKGVYLSPKKQEKIDKKLYSSNSTLFSNISNIESNYDINTLITFLKSPIFLEPIANEYNLQLSIVNNYFSIVFSPQVINWMETQSKSQFKIVSEVIGW